MCSLNNADAIRDRFIEEQAYVQRYIELLQRKTSLDSKDVYEVCNLVEKYRLGKRSDLINGLPYMHPYKLEDMQELHSRLQQIKPNIQSELKEAERKFATLKKPEDLNKVDVRSMAGECIEYLKDALEYDQSSEAIEAVRIEIYEQWDKNQKEQGEEDEPIFIGNEIGTFDQLMDYAVESTLYLLQAERVNALYWILDTMEDIDVTVRMSRTDTEINVLRQGFITLTTIFDATVFDLMKIALKRDFFNLIALFGKQEKVPLDKISKYSSLEEFRDEVIEEQLKSKYLKEILFILRGNNVTLTDTMAGDEFIHLLEMVLRRNVHIHNRGIVDSKYLETNENGVPRYNVYNLPAGAVANIDAAYWERANRLSLDCVSLITAWVNGLP